MVRRVRRSFGGFQYIYSHVVLIGVVFSCRGPKDGRTQTGFETLEICACYQIHTVVSLFPLPHTATPNFPHRQCLGVNFTSSSVNSVKVVHFLPLITSHSCLYIWMCAGDLGHTSTCVLWIQLYSQRQISKCFRLVCRNQLWNLHLIPKPAVSMHSSTPSFIISRKSLSCSCVLHMMEKQ